MPIYAIGDIHGRHDLLVDLLGRIEDDAGSNPHRLVFLGDYVDRGKGSRQVIETLFQLSISAVEQPVFLRGNHEDLLWQVMTDDTPDLTRQWLQHKGNGAAATLQSYGLAAPKLDDLAAIAAIPAQFRRAMPGAHKIIFDGMKDKHETGQYFFSHAGIDPARPLGSQARQDLTWGHAGFLASERDYGKLVVHGHWRTRNYMPEVLPNRIGIDTGAELTGNLTAVRLEPQTPPRFLMTCAY